MNINDKSVLEMLNKLIAIKRLNKNLILIYHLSSSTLKKRLIRHFERLEKVQKNNLQLESSQVRLILL